MIRNRPLLIIASTLLFMAACSIKYIGPGPLPMSMTVENAETNGKATIVRDENYVAHIKADSEEDLYFGAGFAMAQDRFSQIDMLRQAAQGRLAEGLGNPVSYKGLNLVEMDALMKIFRFHEASLEGYAMMDPASRAKLDAFTAGINRYLVELGEKNMFEYEALGRPRMWEPEDSLAIQGIFGLSMTIDCLFNEYYFDRLASVVGPERAMEMAPTYDKDGAVITASAPAANTEAVGAAIENMRVLFRDVLPHPIGSNNWAVAGSRTKTGKALLANDPHVPMFQMPTFWWHVHLQGAGIDAAGMMFPGIPAIGAGSNGKIAWGLTNVMADYIDLFRERVNPNDENQYLYKERWESFRRVSGSIRIKGKKDPVRYSYRVTRHGPVIEDGMVGDYKLRSWAPYEVISMRFVDMYMGDVLTGYFNLLKTSDWDGYRKACSLIGRGPYGWNQIYADAKGNIGYQTTANIPIRVDNQGMIPRRGWTGEEEWDGYVPFDQLPHLYNPPSGFIVTANNRVVGDDYPYYISSSYIPYRAKRIKEVLSTLNAATAEDMMALQNDVIDVRARDIVPYIIADLEAQPNRAKYANAITALKNYAASGFSDDVNATGPTVFYLFFHYMTQATIVDELGKISGNAVSLAPFVEIFIDRIYREPDNKWFDDVTTPALEKRSHVTAKAMDLALKWIESKMGKDPAGWQWGKAHKLTLVQPFNVYMYLRNRDKLSRGPYPYPGNYETVNAAGGIFFEGAGFRVVGGPSSRMVVDFAHPEWFNMAASTGMASNPDDPHYDNLTQGWLAGKYIRMDLSERGYMAGNHGVITLNPALAAE